jgi:hypothetical protein
MSELGGEFWGFAGAKQFAEKLFFQLSFERAAASSRAASAPTKITAAEAGTDSADFLAALKRCPDTNRKKRSR